MKRNFPGLAPTVLLAASLSATAASFPREAPFIFPAGSGAVGVEGGLYFSPAHPALALEPAEPTESYPHVNPSLGGDLSGADGPPVSQNGVRQRERPLAVELAQRGEQGAQVSMPASTAPILLLAAPLLFLGRRRTRQAQGNPLAGRGSAAGHGSGVEGAGELLSGDAELVETVATQFPDRAPGLD